MIRAVCIGEAMVELRPVGEGLYAQGFAGDAFNAAVYLRRSLGRSGEVAFLTGVGDDPLSGALTAALLAQGLDAAMAWVVPGATPGLYMIELDAAGERSFHYWRSASAARGWMRLLTAHGGAEALAGADLVYLSGISLAILDAADQASALELLRALKGRVGTIAFDPNVRLKLWPDLPTARRACEAAAACADILLPSAEDALLLFGQQASADLLAPWLACGAREVALTCGRDGVRLHADGLTTSLSAPAAAAVDTSGAGDSFNGAYLAARLRGADPREAAQAGLALAARVVASPGALIPAHLSHPV